VHLEELFDHDYVAKKPTMVPMEAGVEDVNIRIADNPKMVKLYRYLSHELKGKYIALLSKLFDVFP